MPASMISAPTGGRLNVIGSSMAMAASGPMPGSTPTSVPTITPMKQYIRLIGETAVLNPSVRLGKCSARNSMSVAPPELGIGELQAPDEQRGRAQRQHGSQEQELHRPKPPDREGADDDDERDRGDEAQAVLHRQ